MADIENDIKFLMAVQGLTERSGEKYDAIVLTALNSYLMDYMCNKELESRNLKYSSEYYGAAYESLMENYGSEAALIEYIKSLGLNKRYLEDMCKKQARQSTLTEYLARNIEISEETVLQYYIENSKDFSVDEVRNLFTLYYKTEEQAKAALQQIAATSFMAHYQKQDNESTKDTVYYCEFKSVTKDQFPTNMGTILFELEAGTYYGEPIPCNIGYAIIYVNSITKDYTFTYDEMKDYIEEALRDDMLDEELEKYFNSLNEKYSVEIYI
jgi:hypothetical protein